MTSAAKVVTQAHPAARNKNDVFLLLAKPTAQSLQALVDPRALAVDPVNHRILLLQSYPQSVE